MDAFVELSAALTGFTPRELRETGMAELYHATVLAETREDDYARLLAGDPEVVTLARAVIQLWYTGVGVRSGELSARAYAEGLVWKTFHGAPPGTTSPGFGSWARRPLRTTS
jgi:hypothetical protein